MTIVRGGLQRSAMKVGHHFVRLLSSIPGHTLNAQGNRKSRASSVGPASDIDEDGETRKEWHKKQEPKKMSKRDLINKWKTARINVEDPILKPEILHEDWEDPKGKTVENAFFSTNPKTWKELGIGSELLEALKEDEINKPSHIQEMTIPVIYEGNDCVVGAETGTGKTLAYVLPLAQKLLDDPGPKTTAFPFPKILILTTGRELGEQVLEVTNRVLRRTQLKAAFFYGLDVFPREAAMSPDILITTPRCFKENIKRNINKDRSYRQLAALRHIVFDEADMLLQGNYKLDVRYLITSMLYLTAKVNRNPSKWEGWRIPKYSFVAATLPDTGQRTVLRWLRKRFENAKWISTKTMHKPPGQITQDFLQVTIGQEHKHLEEILIQIKARGDPKIGRPAKRVLVFVNKTKTARMVEDWLQSNHWNCYKLIKDLPKHLRSETLKRFKQRRFQILVATSLLARGMDFPDIDVVINMDFPSNVVDYLHRAGRCGRAGKTGRVISFYTEHELDLVNVIRSAARNVPGAYYSSAFSTNREFMRRIIHLSERGDAVRLSKPRTHEYSFDESRIDEEFIDEDLMNKVQSGEIKFGAGNKKEGQLPFPTEDELDEWEKEDDEDIVDFEKASLEEAEKILGLS